MTVELLNDLMLNSSTYFENRMNSLSLAYSLFELLNSSASSRINKANTKALANKAKETLDAYNVTATPSEIEEVISTILNSTISDVEILTKVERTVAEILKRVSISFLIYSESIFYWASLVGKKILMLAELEKLLLASLKEEIEAMHDYFSRAADSYSNAPAESEFNLQFFVAAKLNEAKINIENLANAVLEGKLNPTSTKEFRKRVENILNVKKDYFNFIQYSPAELMRNFLTKLAYISRSHEQLHFLLGNWGKMLEEFVEAKIPIRFAKPILNYIADKTDYWMGVFENEDSYSQFESFREFLVFMTSSDQVVSTLFDGESPSGNIISSGTTTWIDDNDEDQTSPYVGLIEGVKVGDSLSFDAPTLDESGLTVPSHQVIGVGESRLVVNPEVKKPLRSDLKLYYVQAEGGDTYFPKYESIKAALADLEFPTNLRLAQYESDEIASFRKNLGNFIWEFIDTVSGLFPGWEMDADYVLSELKNRKSKLDSQFSSLETKLDLIMSLFSGLVMPSIASIDKIGSLLLEYSMDILREKFFAGMVKDFFETTPINASLGVSLMVKLDMLMKLYK